MDFFDWLVVATASFWGCLFAAGYVWFYVTAIRAERKGIDPSRMPFWWYVAGIIPMAATIIVGLGLRAAL